MPTQSPQQLQNALNPTPVTYKLPITGQKFRVIGDAKNTYQANSSGGVSNISGAESIANTDLMVNGQLVKKGERIPTPQGAGLDAGSASRMNITPVNSGFSGPLWTTNTLGAYDPSLPEFNLADIQDAIKNGYKFDTGSLTVNGPQPQGTPGTTIVPQGTSPLPVPGFGPNTVINQQTGETAGQAANLAQNLPTNPGQLQPQASPNSSQGAASIYPSTPQTPTSLSSPPQIAEPGVDTNYYIKPGESIDAYNARISQYNASKASKEQSQAVQSSSTPFGDSQGILSDLASKYGFSIPNSSLNPITSFTDTYQQILTQMGIPSAKQEIDNVIAQQDKLNGELQDKVIEINDNPWLAEGIRQRKIQSLENSYKTRLDVLTRQQQLYQSIYDKGIQEAQFVAQQAINIAHDQQTLELNLLDKAMQNAQRLAEIQQQQQSLSPDMKEYGLAVSQGYQGSFIDYKRNTSAQGNKYYFSGNAPQGKTGSSGVFTQTQSNKGAANAGMSITEFRKLPTDDQNFFINGYSQFEKDLTAIRNGSESAQTVANNIAASDQSNAVKQALYKKLGVQPASASTGGSSGIGDFFSNIFHHLLTGQ